MSAMSLTLIHWPVLDVVTFIVIYGALSCDEVATDLFSILRHTSE